MAQLDGKFSLGTMKITIRYHKSTVTPEDANVKNLEILEKLQSFSHPFCTWLPLNKLNHISRETCDLVIWISPSDDGRWLKSSVVPIFFPFCSCLTFFLTIHTLAKHKCMTCGTNAAYESLVFFLNGIDCTLHISIVKHNIIHKRFCFCGCLFYISRAVENMQVGKSSSSILLSFAILRCPWARHLTPFLVQWI